MCFSVSVVLVGPFQRGFASGGMCFAVVKVVDGPSNVYRRAYVGAFNSFRESVARMSRATSWPRCRFKNEECFQV